MADWLVPLFSERHNIDPNYWIGIIIYDFIGKTVFSVCLFQIDDCRSVIAEPLWKVFVWVLTSSNDWINDIEGEIDDCHCWIQTMTITCENSTDSWWPTQKSSLILLYCSAYYTKHCADIAKFKHAPHTAAKYQRNFHTLIWHYSKKEYICRMYAIELTLCDAISSRNTSIEMPARSISMALWHDATSSESYINLLCFFLSVCRAVLFFSPYREARTTAAHGSMNRDWIYAKHTKQFA